VSVPGSDRRPTAGKGGQARLEAAVAAVVMPLVEDAKLECEEVRVRNAGRRKLVRIVVDGDGGVSADELAAVSRTVSRALDDDDPFGPAPYTLEVSTPGVDRPLTRRRHWERAVGRLVAVEMSDAAPRQGRLRQVTDRGVILTMDGEDTSLAWADIARGKVQVEFSHADSESGEIASGEAG